MTTSAGRTVSDRRKRTSDLTKAVIDLCIAYGGYAFRNSNQPRINPKGQPYYPDKSAVGSPDVVAVMPKGVTLWVELKISPDTLRPTQIAFKAELAKRGHNYIVVQDSVDNLAAILALQELKMKITKKPESEG